MQSLDRLAITSVPSIAAIYSPSADYAIAAGDTFELGVTVSNQGSRGAVLKIYLDETSRPLWQWCKLSTQYIALETQQSGEVVFEVPIPLDTPPGTYQYLVVVDADRHYPNENPLQHQAQLTVLPPVQSEIAIDDPTFNLVPQSSSIAPITIQPGAKIELEAVVFNRSNRVDRFLLTAIDIPPSWWQVTYDSNIEELGLVTEANSLALNPQSTAKIRLQIQPPATAKAGWYSSTIQLKSINSPELILLDIVYFQLSPAHSLHWELQAVTPRVSREAGEFAILLHNRGNTLREVSLSVREERAKPVGKYTLAPERVQLLPKSDRSLTLRVKPEKWWRRPWWGKGLPLQFKVECQDLHQLPLARQQLTSTLVWEARPWWHLALLLLATAGSIAGLILAIWWLFFKPPTPPKIREFGAESTVYQASNGDSINLSWQIEHPQTISSISLVGRSTDGKVTSQPISFNFEEGLPESLSKQCTWQRIFYCRNLRTDARQPGDYIFELIVSSNEPKISDVSATTNTITIQPAPTPQITRFAAAANSQENTVYLDFTLTNYEQLKTVQITGFDPDGAVKYPTQKYDVKEGAIATLASYCQQQEKTLICDRVPLSISQPGQYSFELAAIKAKARQTIVVDRQKSATIAIASPQQPQLANLSPSQPIYQEGISNPVLLNWDILQPQQLAAIRLIGRSPEGIVNTPPITYNFSKGVPPELNEYCFVSDIVSCRNVPTQALEAGDYIFKLMSITEDQPNLIDSSITSDLIRIEAIPLPAPPPAPLEILSFEIDGESAPPKYIAEIDPQNPNPELVISWNVLSDPLAKIELLPAPGKVESKGTITYPLSTKATTETLTLRITNPDGRQLERSLIIETAISDESSKPQNLPKSERQSDILVPQDFSPKLN